MEQIKNKECWRCGRMNKGKIYASSKCKSCAAGLLSFDEIESQMVIVK